MPMTIDEKKETAAIANMKRYYWTNERRKVYVALEDLDFVWCETEVSRFDQLWMVGLPVQEIAKQLGRDIDEVVVLAIDRARRGRIKPRAGGLLGGQAVV